MLLDLGLGLIVGVILALTGAGGGILAVPLLVFGAQMSVAQAGPIGLLAVGMAAALGAVLGLKAGTLRYRAAMLIAVTGMLLSPVGLWLARHTDNRWLSVLFALILLSVAYKTFRPATGRPTANESVADPSQPCVRDGGTGRFVWTARCARALALSGTVAGLLSGLLGVGGGFVMVPALHRDTEAVIIDPVDQHWERDLQHLQRLNLKLAYVLETHAHADHVTSAGKLREVTGAKAAVPSGCGIPPADLQSNDGDVIPFGNGEEIAVLHTPGHTVGSMSYIWRGNVFSGDTLLINGCGRTDFQSGSAEALYDSVTIKLFALPDATRVWPAHDYKGQSVSTIGWEKRHNARLANRSREEFVVLMNGLNLPKPKLIDIAVPANQNLGLPHGAWRSRRWLPSTSMSAIAIPGPGRSKPTTMWLRSSSSSPIRLCADVCSPTW